MATQNFALSDWIAIFICFGLFSCLTILPGYALGWIFDVLQFRHRTLPFRLAASVPISIAIGPVVSYLLGRWLSLGAVWMAFGALSVYAVFLIARERFAIPKSQRKFLSAVLGLGLIWIVLAVLMLADMQIGRRLYFPVIAFDYTVRSAFTASIAAWGLPAHTPFFFPGHAVALRYHYYWMIPCAMILQLVERLGSHMVSARQAFIAGTLWCGIGWICLVTLYLRLFSPRGETAIARRTIIGIALLGVTGLDILPALFMIWLYRIGMVGGVSPSVEMWNDQVDGWLSTMLWEPHYLASLIACLMGFLILGDALRGSSNRHFVVSGILAGLAFATAAGSGIYVALVFAVFLTVWAVTTIAKGWYRETAGLVLSGIVATAASIPYLIGLQSPGTGGRFLELTVRSFKPAEMLLTVESLNRPWQSALTNALFLPLNYFLELGFFLAAAMLVWREFRRQKRTPSRNELAAFVMAATSVVVCTFLKSGVQDNDLGWRGFLIAQFVLLLWAVDLLSAPAAIARSDKRFLTVLFALGVAGVVYDLAILRFYPLLSDAKIAPKVHWMGPDEKLGSRTYAEREAYEWLAARTSARSIAQANPGSLYRHAAYGLYADRQTVAEDATCETVFGGDSPECAAIVELLTGLFSDHVISDHPVAISPESICQRLSIDYLVAKDTDGAWADRSSWVWSRPPVFANDFVRLFSCSSNR